MSVVSIRDLSRNPSAVVDEVERSGRPALVTRNGIPIAAIVRIDQDKLEDWVQSSAGEPPIGVSLKEKPEQLRSCGKRIRYGTRTITALTKAEADGFAAALSK
jgi:prevent-host-death family protein